MLGGASVAGFSVVDSQMDEGARSTTACLASGRGSIQAAEPAFLLANIYCNHIYYLNAVTIPRIQWAKTMTLADFAVLVGATPRWCQNALQALGLGFHYDPDLARTLGLARLLQQHHGIALPRAMAVAQPALREGAGMSVRRDDPTGATAILVDVPRYLTQFGLRSARLRADAPRRRGRPWSPPAGGGIAAAEAYGLDLGALRSGLLLTTPAQRLRQLDANQGAVAALRGGLRPA